MLLTLLARLGRALGLLPSKSPTEIAVEIHKRRKRAAATFSRTAVGVFKVDAEGWPVAPGYCKLADLTGIGAAMEFVRAHAKLTGPGRYRLTGPGGDICIVIAREENGAFILDEPEWIDETLWARHHAAKVRQQSPPVAA